MWTSIPLRRRVGERPRDRRRVAPVGDRGEDPVAAGEAGAPPGRRRAPAAARCRSASIATTRATSSPGAHRRRRAGPGRTRAAGSNALARGRASGDPAARRAAAGANRSRPWKVAGASSDGGAARRPRRRRAPSAAGRQQAVVGPHQRARRRPGPPRRARRAVPDARVDDGDVDRARQQRREARQHERAAPRRRPAGCRGPGRCGRPPARPAATTACRAPDVLAPRAEVGEEGDHAGGRRSRRGVLQQRVDEPRDGVLGAPPRAPSGPPRGRSRW